MGIIKINGNDKETVNLSQDQINKKSQDTNFQNSTFELNTALLNTQEAPKPIAIKNLE